MYVGCGKHCAAIGGLICLCFALLWLGLDQQKRATNSQDASYKHQADGQERLQVPGPWFSPDKAPPSDPNPNRDEWRQETDLQAQWETAYWAKVSAFAASVGLVITLIGIHYIRKTLHLNFEAIDLARQANKTARDLGEAQVRAYLQIKEVHVLMDKAHRKAALQIHIRNSGQSPARKLEAVVNFRFFPDARSFQIVYAKTAKVGEHWASFGYADIGPNETFQPGFTSSANFTLPDTLWGAEFEKLAGLHALVVLFAEDVFGYEITAVGHFVQGWSEHANRTDAVKMTNLSDYQSPELQSLHYSSPSKTPGKERHSSLGWRSLPQSPTSLDAHFEGWCVCYAIPLFCIEPLTLALSPTGEEKLLAMMPVGGLWMAGSSPAMTEADDIARAAA